jgi:hypothetical protein
MDRKDLHRILRKGLLGKVIQRQKPKEGKAISSASSSNSSTKTLR